MERDLTQLRMFHKRAGCLLPVCSRRWHFCVAQFEITCNCYAPGCRLTFAVRSRNVTVLTCAGKRLKSGTGKFGEWDLWGEFRNVIHVFHEDHVLSELREIKFRKGQVTSHCFVAKILKLFSSRYTCNNSCRYVCNFAENWDSLFLKISYRIRHKNSFQAQVKFPNASQAVKQ